MIIIDTASIHHSLRAIGKKLDYINFVLYLKEKYPLVLDNFPNAVTIYVDKNAKIFIKYLNKIPDITIIEKEACRKKITKTTKVWYLSFAVDIALRTHNYWATRENITIVSTDIEILPILRDFGYNINLYGIGTPRVLRESSIYSDIPEEYLLPLVKEDIKNENNIT